MQLAGFTKTCPPECGRSEPPSPDYTGECTCGCSALFLRGEEIWPVYTTYSSVLPDLPMSIPSHIDFGSEYVLEELAKADFRLLACQLEFSDHALRPIELDHHFGPFVDRAMDVLGISSEEMYERRNLKEYGLVIERWRSAVLVPSENIRREVVEFLTSRLLDVAVANAELSLV